jgi:hypothetical protein
MPTSDRTSEALTGVYQSLSHLTDDGDLPPDVRDLLDIARQIIGRAAVIARIEETSR